VGNRQRSGTGSGVASAAMPTVLEVDRADVATTRLAEVPPASLDEGQVRVRVDRSAVTANTVTYALAGDMLGYWDFFPTGDLRWGRVPAMGWGDVVESSTPGVEEGTRVFGWFPLADEVTFTATATADGFRDDGPHRDAHAAVYRSYRATDRDSWYQGPELEDRHALLRGLFLTGLLADEHFADAGDEPYLGAEQVVVLSASSKTAIGYAQRASARPGLRLVGLTSAANTGFVVGLGFYDQVTTYEDIDAIDAVPSVSIDMAGNGEVRAALHRHLGDQLRHAMTVGLSHGQVDFSPVEHGPQPEMFFAPTEVERRMREWGADDYDRRTTEALFDFVADSERWLRVEAAWGADGVAETWRAVQAGEVPPDVGRITGHHEP
jgi:hypothetical protein